MSQKIGSIEELSNLIMQLQRASVGKTPIPEDVISKLINIKSMFERTGFPTYTILGQCVYLKLGAWVFNKRYGNGNPEEPQPADGLDKWADFLMEALIAYKRQQRKEAIELSRKMVETPETTTFNLGQPTPVKASKRRFWQRGQPKEQSEFKEK